jgi:hypothetical protein
VGCGGALRRRGAQLERVSPASIACARRFQQRGGPRTSGRTSAARHEDSRRLVFARPFSARCSDKPRRSITGMSDSGSSRTADLERLCPTGRRPRRWTPEEVLEQVGRAGGPAEAVARAVVDWAVGHPNLGLRGGRGTIDRSLTMYADSGRGKGVLCLYAAENGGGPMLEVRIESMCSMPPYDDARAQLMTDLCALGIPRLDSEDILTAVRPSVPLDQLSGGRLERLLTLVERFI